MKQFSPAAERNKEPILRILKKVLPAKSRVLEVASGSGQHADFFTKQWPEVVWQPSETSQEGLKSINAFRDEAKLENFLSPVRLSTNDDDPELPMFDAIVCCNMIHISPWSSCHGLFRLASKHLENDGLVILYGPFFRNDCETSPSNISFDESLKKRNVDWGIRQLEQVTETAQDYGMVLNKVYEMPANNLVVVFQSTIQS